MARDTVTIALDGDIPLRIFAEAIREFDQVVSGLAAELAEGTPIDWLMEDLRIGSAIAATRGIWEDPAPVEKVVRGYEDLFRSIQEKSHVDFSPRVTEPAYNLTRLVGGRVVAVHFYTDEFEAVIERPQLLHEPSPYRKSFGAVQGVVENLYRRTRRFTLIDQHFHRPVSCHLDAGQEEIMRNAWGNLASVEGLISRDTQTGRPVMVDNIRSVTVLGDERGQFRNARGVLPRETGSPRAEDVIREIRDAPR